MEPNFDVSRPERERNRRFAAVLRNARIRAGITQVEMAEKLKRTQSYVSKVESGERHFSLAEWESFAWVLKVHPVSLLEEAYADSRIRKTKSAETDG